MSSFPPSAARAAPPEPCPPPRCRRAPSGTLGTWATAAPRCGSSSWVHSEGMRAEPGGGARLGINTCLELGLELHRAHRSGRDWAAASTATLLTGLRSQAHHKRQWQAPCGKCAVPPLIPRSAGTDSLPVAAAKFHSRLRALGHLAQPVALPPHKPSCSSNPAIPERLAALTAEGSRPPCPGGGGPGRHQRHTCPLGSLREEERKRKKQKDDALGCGGRTGVERDGRGPGAPLSSLRKGGGSIHRAGKPIAEAPQASASGSVLVLKEVWKGE